MGSLPKKVLLLLALLFCKNSNCDYYTSVTTLHDLLEAESRVISFFEEYMANMEEISRHVNEKLNELENQAKKADGDSGFYENPLNAFKIIRRFAIDLQNLRRAIFSERPTKTYISHLTSTTEEEGFVRSTYNDVLSTSKRLARLQRTYQQKTTDVADGYLMGTNYATEMTAYECYWLGHTLFETKNYEYAAEWLLQARIRLAAELKAANGTRQFPQLTDVQVLLKLAPAMFALGKSKLALLFNDEILDQDPTNSLALENIALYMTKALEERHPTPFDDLSSKTEQPTEIEKIFDELCRGDLEQTARQKRKLRCRYVHNNVPFRYIAPFKKEELNLDPPVAYYHEFASENEIDNILDKAEDSVQRSVIGKLEESFLSDVRTSQSTWLSFNNHTFLYNLAQRLRDVTGLSLESAEDLQVANYDVGGHYGPHYDFDEDPNYDFQGRENRILTAMIYLSDVELGGATAFPYLKVTAAPIKGSVLVWDNLHKSLELDYRTKHGGCPVMVGSKWVGNEWFHVVGQEFKRPCDLKKDGYKSLRFKDLH